jgi:hypothetical protein
VLEELTDTCIGLSDHRPRLESRKFISLLRKPTSMYDQPRAISQVP